MIGGIASSVGAFATLLFTLVHYQDGKANRRTMAAHHREMVKRDDSELWWKVARLIVGILTLAVTVAALVVAW